VDDAKTGPEGRRQEADPGRRPDERETGELQANRPGVGTLGQDDVHPEILQGRVEDLLTGRVQAVDLVDEQDVAGLQVRQDGHEVTGPFDGRTGRDLDLDAHFVGQDVRQSRFAQTRRTVQEDVV
jgi:hypothetical protein